MYEWRNNWEPITDDCPSALKRVELHSVYDQMMHGPLIRACTSLQIVEDLSAPQLDCLELHLPYQHTLCEKRVTIFHRPK